MSHFELLLSFLMCPLIMGEGGGALGHTLKFQLTVDILNFKDCQKFEHSHTRTELECCN